MYILILLIPLILSIYCSFNGRYIGIKGIESLIKIIMLLLCIINIIILYEILSNNIIIKIKLFNWLEINDILFTFNFEYNKISIIMCNLVLLISTIVLYYSFWYMSNDPHIIRFITYLLYFTFFMLLFVLSNNLLLTFLAWEGIGIFSYFLINFWFTRIQANKSALKAVYYNRIGDTCLIYSIIIILSITHISNLNIIDNINIFINNQNIINIILFLILFACLTKSAQFLFHPWLASSMEGPTPVSALLHAATMVTAGIYLLMKFELLLSNSIILYILLFYSLLTIIFSGITSFFQSDIKKIIAFSTSAQLAYMFLAISIKINGFFHLFTHGFFKALLFLLAGIIIHSFLNNQDIRKFGSFIYFLPLSYCYFLIGTLAIISFPFLSGYYSKEIILENLYLYPIYIYLFGLLGSILTILYSIKLLYKIFFNNININFYNFIHLSDAPISLFIILFILILGSIFIGYIFNDLFIGPGIYNYDYDFIPFYIKLLPTIFIIIIILLLILILNISTFKIYKNYIIKFKSFYQYYSVHLFFDSIINTLIIKSLSFISYSYIFKFIDRGLLESIPISLYRLFKKLSLFPKFINTSSYNIYNNTSFNNNSYNISSINNTSSSLNKLPINNNIDKNIENNSDNITNFNNYILYLYFILFSLLYYIYLYTL